MFVSLWYLSSAEAMKLCTRVAHEPLSGRTLHAAHAVQLQQLLLPLSLWQV